VGAETGADEDGVEDVVDGGDDEASPEGEERGFAPVSGEAEVESDGSPDEDGSKGRDEGHDGGDEGPEDGFGYAESPVGEAGEDALDGGDDEASEGGGVDGVVEAMEEFGGFVIAEGQEGAQEVEGLGTVAEEEEEDEEHDDELRDDAS